MRWFVLAVSLLFAGMAGMACAAPRIDPPLTAPIAAPDAKPVQLDIEAPGYPKPASDWGWQEARIRHGGISVGGGGGGLPGPCQFSGWAGDNGCANSTFYVANPGFQDTNFAYDISQSGQCANTCTGADLTTRNNNIHHSNVNLPGVDYPIGAAASGLPLISTFPGDSTCTFHATGVPAVIKGSGSDGPYLQCTTLSNGQNYTLQGWDMKDGSGNCVPVQISPLFLHTGGSFYFINDNWKTQGSCLTYDNPGVGTGFVYAPKSSSMQYTDIYFINTTMDGQYASLTPNSKTGCFTGFIDNRGGPSNPNYVGFHSLYSVWRNLCSISIAGVDIPSLAEAHYSVFWNMCMGGVIDASGGASAAGCHGEMWEYVGNGLSEQTPGVSARNDVAIGNVFAQDSVNYIVDITTPVYCTSGNANGQGVNNCDIEDNYFMGNMQFCAGSGPYSVTSPCTTKTIGGQTSVGSIAYGLVAFQWATFVTTLTIKNNTLDEGAHNAGGGGLGMIQVVNGGGCNIALGTTPNECTHSATFTMSATLNQGGATSTLQETNGNYTPGVGANSAATGGGGIWAVGTGIGSVNDNNDNYCVPTFTAAAPCYITAFGSYTNCFNYPTSCGTVANPCVVGVNPGCGEFAINQATEPAIPSGFRLFQFAYVGNIIDDGKNFAIGGSGPRQITLGYPPYGPHSGTNKYVGKGNWTP
jgi:hypothetical protein